MLLLLLENLLSGIAPSTNTVFSFLFVLFFAAVPFAFLFGIPQSRLARGSVAGLMVSLEHGRPLRDAIADALGDPSLGVAFWVEDGGRWVARGYGSRLLIFCFRPDQAITVVERDGRRIAALLHDDHQRYWSWSRACRRQWHSPSTTSGSRRSCGCRTSGCSP